MSAETSAAEIRQRMAQVRADLLRSTDALKHNAQTLTDWRYHVRRHPWLTFGAAGVVAFLAVPRRAAPAPSPVDAETLARLAEQQRVVVAPAGSRSGGPSLLNSLATTAGNALLRTGLAYLSQYVGQVVGGAVAARAAPAQRQETNGASTDGKSI